MAELTSQERLMALVEYLSTKKLAGADNRDVAVFQGGGATQACRDLAALANQGWVERMPGGTWRLSPKFAQFSAVMAQAFKDAVLDLKMEEARFLKIAGGN